MKFDFLSQKTVLAITAFILFSGSVGICDTSKVCTFPDDVKHQMKDMSITIIQDDAGKITSVKTMGSDVAVTKVGSQAGSPTFTLKDFPARGYTTEVNLNYMNTFYYNNEEVRGESFTIHTPQSNLLPTKGLDCEK